MVHSVLKQQPTYATKSGKLKIDLRGQPVLVHKVATAVATKLASPQLWWLLGGKSIKNDQTSISFSIGFRDFGWN